MEYFGVFQRLLGHFVLISFRTYDGFLSVYMPSRGHIVRSFDCILPHLHLQGVVACSIVLPVTFF